MRCPLPILVAVGLGVAGPAGPGAADGLCEIEENTGAFPDLMNFFGNAVAIRGDLAVISTPGENLDMQGSAHVYRLAGSGLTLQTVLYSGIVDTQNDFGAAIAIDGTVLAVSDDRESADAPAGGAVYVYRLNSGLPVFEQKLVVTNAVGIDVFGASVAAWGETILVGASRHTPTPQAPEAGAAYIFRYRDALWREEAYLLDPVPQQYAVVGASVAIVGDLAMVGAPGDGEDDPAPGTDTGAVLVFGHQDGQWTFQQKLKPSDAVPAGGFVDFGRSVALDAAGERAVIGAPQDLGQDGSAYVFEYDGSSWVETAKLQAKQPVGTHPFFGANLDISQDGQTIVVGAGQDSEAGFEAGAAHLFRRIGDEWVEVFKFIRPGSACLGARVAIDGDLALVSDTCGFSGGKVYLLAGIDFIDCNGNGEPDSCDIAAGFSNDAGGNGIPDECAVFGDLDGDGLVGVVDFLSLLGTWGPCPAPCPPSCPGDLDGDCAVGVTDFLLLLGAWTVPPPPPDCPGSGDCCAVDGSAGCDDPACCEAVCTADPFCCEVVWDMVCVSAAQASCGCTGPQQCGIPGAGDCCAFGGLGGPGCSDAACCQAICQYVDPFCCQVQWDSSCTAWALQFCDCPPAACNPKAGNCCASNGSPGCNDPECCTLVCEEIDPFCCEANWDAICASEAQDFCKVCGGSPPGG